jgi:hypothetical protein
MVTAEVQDDGDSPVTPNEIMTDWLASNLMEDTGKLVRETVGWFTGDAVGGLEALAVLEEAAGEVANNLGSHYLRDYPGLEPGVRESLRQLLVAEACAIAAGRDDLVEHLDYLLGSFCLGNPVLGIGQEGELIVITE